MRSRRSHPTGFIAPCLPSAAERPPAEPGWIHEIKHRGHQVLARRSSAGVRLFARNGLDWSKRYPAAAIAVALLRCRSCLIDGQAVACDDVSLPRRRENVVLFAFDLLELDGRDLRREPIETRKTLLAKLLEHAKPALQLSEDMAEAGDVAFRYACELGLDGIVSKRLGSSYRSGRSRDWITTKTRQPS
jgi:bifunctional non-homologous end joining protein LigD